MHSFDNWLLSNSIERAYGKACLTISNNYITLVGYVKKSKYMIDFKNS
jgi:hypothetical protein